MIKDNQKVFNRLMIIIDAVIAAASFMLAYFFKFYILNRGPGPGVLPASAYFRLLVFILPVYMLVYYFSGVYAPKRTVRRRFEVFGIVRANTIGIVVIIILLYMIIREFNVSRSVLAFFYFFNVFITTCFRLSLRKGLRTIRSNGYNLRHILLVGYSRAAEEYIDRLLEIYQRISHDGYYVKMAVAWAVSVCYVKFPEKTGKLLEKESREAGGLSDWTHNKAIQKIRESRRVSDEEKEALNRLKRK